MDPYTVQGLAKIEGTAALIGQIGQFLAVYYCLCI